MWREVSSTYITRAQITRANIDFNGGGSRLVHCRDRLADASGEDLGRGHPHEQLTGLHTVPVPRGCATTVSSRPLGTGSGVRGGSLPQPQRLQHAQHVTPRCNYGSNPNRRSRMMSLHLMSCGILSCHERECR